jgi:hypothetical protein
MIWGGGWKNSANSRKNGNRNCQKIEITNLKGKKLLMIFFNK